MVDDGSVDGTPAVLVRLRRCVQVLRRPSRGQATASTPAIAVGARHRTCRSSTPTTSGSPTRNVAARATPPTDAPDAVFGRIVQFVSPELGPEAVAQFRFDPAPMSGQPPPGDADPTRRIRRVSARSTHPAQRGEHRLDVTGATPPGCSSRPSTTSSPAGVCTTPTWASRWAPADSRRSPTSCGCTTSARTPHGPPRTRHHEVERRAHCPDQAGAAAAPARCCSTASRRGRRSRSGARRSSSTTSTACRSACCRSWRDGSATSAPTTRCAADKYIRATVFLATVLFLVGISGHFRIRQARMGLIGAGGLLLAFAVVQLLDLPGPPS